MRDNKTLKRELEESYFKIEVRVRVRVRVSVRLLLEESYFKIEDP